MTAHIIDGENYNCGTTVVHVPVDTCVADIVQALVDAKLHPISSCCGHGAARAILGPGTDDSGRIMLIDGRTIEVRFPDDWEAHREVES